MHLKTRLTERLGIEHRILLAPMNVLSGGKLAAEVSKAGGLGIIGGGYGDSDWLEQQFAVGGERAGWLRVHHVVDGARSEASRSGSCQAAGGAHALFRETRTTRSAHQGARGAADLPGAGHELSARSRRRGRRHYRRRGLRGRRSQRLSGRVPRSSPKLRTTSPSTHPIPSWSRRAA